MEQTHTRNWTVGFIGAGAVDWERYSFIGKRESYTEFRCAVFP